MRTPHEAHRHALARTVRHHPGRRATHPAQHPRCPRVTVDFPQKEKAASDVLVANHTLKATEQGEQSRGRAKEERSGGGRETACMHPRLTAAAFLAPLVHVVTAFSAASMRAPAPVLRARATAASHFADSAYWHPQARAPGGEGNMQRVVHASCGDEWGKFDVQWMLLYQPDDGSAISNRQQARAWSHEPAR